MKLFNKIFFYFLTTINITSVSYATLEKETMNDTLLKASIENPEIKTTLDNIVNITKRIKNVNAFQKKEILKRPFFSSRFFKLNNISQYIKYTFLDIFSPDKNMRYLDYYYADDHRSLWQQLDEENEKLKTLLKKDPETKKIYFFIHEKQEEILKKEEKEIEKISQEEKIKIKASNALKKVTLLPYYTIKYYCKPKITFIQKIKNKIQQFKKIFSFFHNDPKNLKFTPKYTLE